MLGCGAFLLLLTLVLPASAEGKPYYAIPVAIFILVAILLVICITLWVVPYCVDHQRKRKRQTDAAKSANLYDDDDEISTAYKDKAAEAAGEEKSSPYYNISHPQVNNPPPPEKEAVDSASAQPYSTSTPYFFPVNPKPVPSPVYPRADQYGVAATPGEETEL